VCFVGLNKDGLDDIAEERAAVEAASAVSTHAGAADPHTGYQLESDVVETAAAGKVPKATSRGVLDPTWLALCDCGDGSDGDLTVSGTVYLEKDRQYRTLTIQAGGKIVCDTSTNVQGGWQLRAWVLDVSTADAYSITSKGRFLAPGNGIGAGGAGQGHASIAYGGSAGAAIRAPGGSSGTTGAGNAGTSVSGGNYVGGKYRGNSGSGGAGSSGAGGSLGVGNPAGDIYEPIPPALTGQATMQSSAYTGGANVLAAAGGASGAGGAGGGGDGVNPGGGGGAGGQGTKPLDIRVGVLVVGANTNAPMIDGRGGYGGNGANGTGGNTGGGGGGGGAGGNRIYFEAGVIVADANVAGWFDASGGNGGAGGNGVGTGGGGWGGGGGGGGRIVVRRRALGVNTDQDDRGSSNGGAVAPDGATGGTGATGVACLAGLLS
jgi:hypothetical protein